MTACIRCVISGRVQGVWFRAATRDQARALGIDGHARNLDDGRVEVLARGPAGALQQLRDWLHQGPPRAQVASVDCESSDAQPEPGFRTL